MARRSVRRKALSSSEIPLLKAYLRTIPGYPPHVPAWIPTVGWIVFLVLAFLSFLLPTGEVFALIASGILSYLLVVLMRKRCTPRNDLERADETRFTAIRRLKGMLDDNLHKRLPPDVLIALEKAVEAHNVVTARISTEEAAWDGKTRIDRALQACFIAAMPVVRGEECSRGDWDTLLENDTLIDAVVETIQMQTATIQDCLSGNRERLAALQELDEKPELRSVRILD